MANSHQWIAQLYYALLLSVVLSISLRGPATVAKTAILNLKEGKFYLNDKRGSPDQALRTRMDTVPVSVYKEPKTTSNKQTSLVVFYLHSVASSLPR